MELLFHNLSEKDKEDIKKQVNSILNTFSKKLATLKEDSGEQFIEREKCIREEEKEENPAELSKKIMFENAPNKNENSIIAETKKW